MIDLDPLRRCLEPVATASRSHEWARQRPWSTATHVWLEGDLPIVDLHDLGRSTARKAVAAVVGAADDHHLAAVCFVVGRGRRSATPGVLGPVVEGELQRACAEVGAWRYRPRGPGRLILIFDPTRVPAGAGGRVPLVVWAVLVALIVGLAIGLARC